MYRRIPRGGVALLDAKHRVRLVALLDQAGVLVREGQGGALDELVKLLEPRRANNRRDHARLPENPRERDLDGSRALGAGPPPATRSATS